MAEQIEEIVKRGRWFFDRTVPAEVRIVRRNFTDPSGSDDEMPEGCIGDVPPPYGPDGFYYCAIYEMTGRDGVTTRSGTGLYNSFDAIVREVETTLNGNIIWDEPVGQGYRRK